MIGEESSGENSKRRAGQVHKSLWISDADWGVVERRMRSYGQKNFSKFAREVLTNGIVSVAYSKSIADEINRALAPIGNNVNQIARKANTDGFATLQQLNEIFLLLEELYALVSTFKSSHGSSKNQEDLQNTQDLD